MLTLRKGEVVWVPVPVYQSFPIGTGSKMERTGTAIALGIVAQIPDHPAKPYIVALRQQEHVLAFPHEMKPYTEGTAEDARAYFIAGGVVVAEVEKVVGAKGRVLTPDEEGRRRAERITP